MKTTDLTPLLVAAGLGGSSMSGAKHTLRIEGWHPRRLNELLGCHHMKAHRLKRQDAETVAAECVRQEVPRAAGKRRVKLWITLAPRQRGADPDAYFKSLLDALVCCGRLKGDSREWAELAPVEYYRGPRKVTTVTLEDVE